MIGLNLKLFSAYTEDELQTKINEWLDEGHEVAIASPPVSIGDKLMTSIYYVKTIRA